MKLTPVQIQVLLHIYVTPFQQLDIQVPSIKMAIEMWFDKDCIQPGKDVEWKCTTKGVAYVMSLLHIPEPVPVWATPDGTILA